MGIIWDKLVLSWFPNQHQNSQHQTDSLEGEEQTDDVELLIETDCEQKLLKPKQRLNISTEDEESPKSLASNVSPATFESERETPNGQNDPVHIKRTVSSILVKTERILYSFRSRNDVLFIVNCDENFANQLAKKEGVHTMELSKYMNKAQSKIPQNVLILSTTNKCTSLQFETICEVSGTSNVYVLQQFDEEHCILILSKGEKLEYANATKTFNKEPDLWEIYNPFYTMSMCLERQM